MTRVEQVLAFLRKYRDERLIKLVIGLRGCGKSSALKAWSDVLIADKVKSNHIISCNLEDPRNRPLLVTERLIDWIEGQMPKGNSPVHVILDEVCECQDFEGVIGVLYANSRINLTIACSNRRPISARFREYLSGRCVYTEMLPPSFAEVPLAKRNGFEARLTHILNYGMMPYLNRYRGTSYIPEVSKVYLQGLWNTILVKDILTRNRLADSRLTEKLLGRIYDHLGEGESLRRIAAGSVIEGCEASPNTIESYLDALDESMLIRRLDRYDVFTGEVLKTGYRFYLGEIGLGIVRYGDYPGGEANAIRNLIAQELAGRGGRLYCGRYDGSDFDFVVVRGDKCSCWQFVPELVDGAVPTPVVSGLKRVPDSVPRYVITRRTPPKRRVRGLDYVTLEDFLMNRNLGK